MIERIEEMSFDFLDIFLSLSLCLVCHVSFASMLDLRRHEAAGDARLQDVQGTGRNARNDMVFEMYKIQNLISARTAVKNSFRSGTGQSYLMGEARDPLAMRFLLLGVSFCSDMVFYSSMSMSS